MFIYYFALYIALVGVTPMLAAAMAAWAIDLMDLQIRKIPKKWHVVKADKIFPEIYCRLVGGLSEILPRGSFDFAF